ncbi:unnamed protein product [Rotaria sp. Silwood2]|nr:unnamed protein product [Rotaria sp. Silwood2]CAF2655120.1 unnamed protein product [Rotaria sp. Silwood2]CAF2860784.1 unnamed protein product [Rotaria sp. Silwood2]CAF3027928.1 unnamed protein product [Rotaria sp. Silwood2]CAF3891604.1 unnamed protein product [Rotaria sp. Silwood2]
MIVRSTFFKLITSGIFIFGVVVLTLNYISYHQNRDNYELIDNSDAYVIPNHNGDPLIRIKADVKSNSKPAILYANDGKIDIPKDQNVLVREAGESNFKILLLHGQAFSSQIWEKIGTLQYLASWGYQAFAIDLPGYGNSSLPVVQETAGAQWLTKLIRSLRLSNFVIISPSMSGRFSLPYVIQSNTKQQSIRGFIPISPVGTKKFDINNYKQVQISTLIVYGENDAQFESAINDLKQIPSSEVLIIKNASHACYVQQPLEFHNGLRQFLYNVYHPIYIEQYKKRLESIATHTSSLSSSVKLNDSEGKKRKKLTEKSTSNEKQQHTH